MEKVLLLKFPPVQWETIWGDGTLVRRYNMEVAEGCNPDRSPVGGGFSETDTIVNGEFAGQTVDWLFKNHPEYFGTPDELTWTDALPVSLGACWASADLSVQVHPQEEWSLKNLGIHGKSECWYFPETRENNTVVAGTRANTMEELDEYIRNNDWENLLVRHPVKPGSFYAIEAGTVHAVQEGSYFIEICNPSPVTYRFYDYDRLDADGKPRQLDIERAKQNLLLPGAPIPFEEIITQYGDVTERWMADNKHYSAWLWTSEGKGTVPKKKPFIGAFVIYGEGTINGVAVKAGDSFMCTKACDEVEIDGKMTILCCHG